jgi:hypothetical protein
MGILRVLSRSGDDRVTWELTEVEAEVPEAVAAVREAERIFAAVRARGGTAFRVDPGQAPVRLDRFDRTAEQIVMVPRVVGG